VVSVPIPVMRAVMETETVMMTMMMRTAHEIDLSIRGRVCEQGAGGCGDHQAGIGACLVQHVGSPYCSIRPWGS
jgi:hypothetical protein